MYIFNDCCAQCIHNKICSNKDHYSEIGERIKKCIDENDTSVKVTASCEYYLHAGTTTFRGVGRQGLLSNSITAKNYENPMTGSQCTDI